MKRIQETFSVGNITPLRGQLDAAFPLKPAAGPPLSVVNTIMLLSSIPLLARAFTTCPTESSTLDIIAVKTLNTIISIEII